MTFDWNWNPYDFDVDIKQDVETYIDWDVDTKFNTDINKDIDIDINVDIDVKDNGATVEAVVKDFDLDFKADDILVVGSVDTVEDVYSHSDLTVVTDNIQAQLTADASDNGYYFDTSTFTEINLGIDNVAGDFTIITLDMQALADG
jgi:hypothetical protein